MNLPFLRQQEEDGSLFHNVLSAQGILPIGMDIQNESAGSIDNERNPLNQPDMMETSSSRLNDAGVSYSELIGIPSKLTTLLTVIVISPEESTWMQQLCEGVELYLANRYIFCRISVYNKKEYAIALQSTACDLCIVYKEQLETVSVSFPSMYCAEYSCTDINVGLDLIFQCRMTSPTIRHLCILSMSSQSSVDTISCIRRPNSRHQKCSISRVFYFQR